MIGIFDSGIGGLSVWKELITLMPEQQFCYVADSAFCPYGRKSPQELQKRSRKLTDFLINQGNCELIVVACNTATAAAIEILRAGYNIPFVGMEPAIKPAILHSKTGVVGVLATAGTFKGAIYHKTLTQFQGNVKVIEEIGDGLVELVEQNKTEGKKAEELLIKYITPMIKANADHIVLGCTHYPFLVRTIEKILEKERIKDKVAIVNPAPAVALQVQRLLNTPSINSGNSKDNIFYSTGDEKILKIFVEKIINGLPPHVKEILNINHYKHVSL